MAQWLERSGGYGSLPMSRPLGLRLLIVLLVTMVMGHFLVNRRLEWTDNINQAFSQAWEYLGEGNVDAGGLVMDPNNNPDPNNNDRDAENEVNSNSGIQNVWGEDSFREDDDQTCAGSGAETNQEES